MKKQMILILCLISALAGKAQDSTHVEVPAPVVATPSLAYGYFSYNGVLQAMPDYVAAQKRQAELQDMMAKNVAFKEESVRLLEKAEKDLMQPVRNKLNTAIQHVGKELKLAFVLNTDNNALPYVDASMGRDITNEVMKAIGK